MPNRNMEFTSVGPVFANTAERTISGTVIPLSEVAAGGLRWRFEKGSVQMDPARCALTVGHGAGFGGDPIGKLVKSEWNDSGLQCTYRVSDIPSGTDALKLAADGVYSFSVGLNYETTGADNGDGVYVVSKAVSNHTALTSNPAFAGATIQQVNFERGSAMPDAPVTTEPVQPAPTPPVTPPTGVAPPAGGAITFSAEQFASLFGNRITDTPPAPTPGPTPQPLPQVAVTREEAPYIFANGANRGKHGFLADIRRYAAGDSEVVQRMNTWLKDPATFAAVAADSDTVALTPPTYRPDLWQGPLTYPRPLGGLVTQGPLTDIRPMILPKWKSSGTMTAVHVQGVEPSESDVKAESQTINPGAQSGICSITRELYDLGGSPAVDSLIWSEQLRSLNEGYEVAVQVLLDAASLPVSGVGQQVFAINGSDAVLVKAATKFLAGLQLKRGGDRFTSLGLASGIFLDLVGAADSTGRGLLPVLGPVNSVGTTATTFGRVVVGDDIGVPCWALAVNGYSYALNPASVVQYVSAPQRFDINIKVSEVSIGIFAYSVEAILRATDVLRITHTP